MHGTTPRNNADYWLAKLTLNLDRDRRVTAALQAHGWNVARFWEHEQVDEVVAAIFEFLDYNQRQPQAE
jgi:DNA mismatch endonuclease (patch repair protein)